MVFFIPQTELSNPLLKITVIEVKKVSTNNELSELSDLATSIWKEHYSTLLGDEQANYMANEFQSLEVIKNDFDDYFFVEYLGRRVGYLSLKQTSLICFLTKFTFPKMSEDYLLELIV